MEGGQKTNSKDALWQYVTCWRINQHALSYCGSTWHRMLAVVWKISAPMYRKKRKKKNSECHSEWLYSTFYWVRRGSFHKILAACSRYHLMWSLCIALAWGLSPEKDSTGIRSKPMMGTTSRNRIIEDGKTEKLPNIHSGIEDNRHRNATFCSFLAMFSFFLIFLWLQSK